MQNLLHIHYFLYTEFKPNQMYSLKNLCKFPTKMVFAVIRLWILVTFLQIERHIYSLPIYFLGSSRHKNKCLWQSVLWLPKNSKYSLILLWSRKKVKHYWVGFTSHSRIFHSYGDVTNTNEGLQILTYTRYSWRLSSVLHLLWHGSFV